MYTVALVLFAFPCVLLLTAGIGALKARRESPTPSWRMNCLTGALFTGSCMIIAGLAFLFAWLHAGGNPHGTGTPPGNWQVLRQVFWCSVVATTILTIFGKGRGRFLLLSAVVSAILANFLVIILEMD